MSKMTLEKLSTQDTQSLDIRAENIAKLKALFPEILTEKGIDFTVLKQLLGEEIEEAEERYSFTWNGKAQARRLAQTPSTGTLRPCKEESKDWDSTQNLFIEGDNLEVLKLLQKSYHQQVKMIYIDPPYNTGKDFIYPDDFSDNIKNYLELTGQTDEVGIKFSANSETSGRYHTNWLNMIYPRLKLARNLLRDDGVIFISIDDDEVCNLRKVSDEIFGEENFLAQIVWKKKTNGNNQGAMPAVHDLILVYSKSIESLDESNFGYPITQSYIDKTFSNQDDDPRGPWTTMDLSANHKGPYFEIVNPNTGDVFLPAKGRYWVFNEAEVKNRIADGRIIFGKTGKSGPIQKSFLKDKQTKRIKAESWWDKHGLNADGTKELAELLEHPKLFDHSKPSSLIQNIIEISTDKDECHLILDFFSGSGTSGHAAILQNSKDGGNRRFICVQLDELIDKSSDAFKAGYVTIADIGKERIRRAGEKIVTNINKSGIKNIDAGFKVFKLDSSNIKPWDADFDTLSEDLLSANEVIKPERTQEDVLFEILLKYGLDLNLPVNVHTLEGKTVFEVGAGALLVCLDKDVTESVAEAIGQLKAKLTPAVCRVVFRDAGFADDAAKVNAVQVLKQFGIDDVKSL